MALEDSVNDLVDATTDLLNAVNVNKATLDAAVASADASEASAITSANQAATSAASALAIYGNTSVMNAAVASATTAANTATTKASEASTSATNAAASASSAAAIVTGVASNRASIRPSLLLDFANTKQLDPRITFTRASTGTFYDGKSMVKAEENLLTYSQEFDNAVGWPFLNAASVTANTTTAPDNTNTADTLTFNGGGTSCRISRTVTATALDATRSIFVKAGTASFVQLLSAGDGTAFANFDVSTGTVGTVGSGVTASIVSAGNGWYRLVMTFAKSGATEFRLQGVDSNTAAYGSTLTTGGTVYIWGAQLEQRSSVTAYTPTTTQPITNYIPALQTAALNEARFDCDPVTGESKGLLIEEQRTNLLTYSEQFDNSAWTKANATALSNTVIAPDGTLSADKLIESTANALHYVQEIITGATNGSSYTLSVYAKASGRNVLEILDAYASVGRTFDLSAGTVGSAQSGVSNAATYSITPVGNGWYKCSISVTASGTSVSLRLAASNGTTTSYTGDGYSGIYIWGAQLEAGSFPTSYIPTVASQVTRSADAASMTGSNFSSWYRADEGTLYAEAAFGGFPSTSNPISASLNDGTTNNHIIMMEYNTNARIQTEVKTSGAVQVGLILQSPVSTNTYYRHVLAYKVNDVAACSSGGTVQTDTSVSLPTVNQLGIGVLASGNYTNGTIKRITYYPKRLSNTELQGITS